MKTNRGKTKTVSGMLVLIVILSIWSLSMADDGVRIAHGHKEAESIKAIEQRVENLESSVGSSRTPISERIDVVEKGLRGITRAMGGSGWTNVESNLREAKKIVTESAQQRRKIEGDLKELRQVIKQVERLKNELTKLRRDMDSMERRLRKLESQS